MLGGPCVARGPDVAQACPKLMVHYYNLKYEMPHQGIWLFSYSNTLGSCETIMLSIFTLVSLSIHYLHKVLSCNLGSTYRLNISVALFKFSGLSKWWNFKIRELWRKLILQLGPIAWLGRPSAESPAKLRHLVRVLNWDKSGWLN